LTLIKFPNTTEIIQKILPPHPLPRRPGPSPCHGIGGKHHSKSTISLQANRLGLAWYSQAESALAPVLFSKSLGAFTRGRVTAPISPSFNLLAPSEPVQCLIGIGIAPPRLIPVIRFLKNRMHVRRSLFHKQPEYLNIGLTECDGFGACAPSFGLGHTMTQGSWETTGDESR
jgi:hypothetical protein